MCTCSPLPVIRREALLSTPTSEWGEEQRARSARLNRRLSSMGRSQQPESPTAVSPPTPTDLTGQAGSYSYMAPEASACLRAPCPAELNFMRRRAKR